MGCDGYRFMLDVAGREEERRGEEDETRGGKRDKKKWAGGEETKSCGEGLPLMHRTVPVPLYYYGLAVC